MTPYPCPVCGHANTPDEHCEHVSVWRGILTYAAPGAAERIGREHGRYVREQLRDGNCMRGGDRGA